MDEHEPHDHEHRPSDVEIEEVSEWMLRVKVGRIVTDVTVEKIYRTPRSFGEFSSLDSVVAFLRKKSEEDE